MWLLTLGSKMCSCARSPSSALATYAAADSRTSPVSFLKANPRIAIFLPVTLLNMRETMVRAKRSFCQSFRRTTECQ
jgi:hypothetical protein